MSSIVKSELMVLMIFKEPNWLFSVGHWKMGNLTAHNKYTFEIRDPDFKIIFVSVSDYNMIIIESLGI